MNVRFESGTGAFEKRSEIKIGHGSLNKSLLQIHDILMSLSIA
jgi:hypothetical protein